VKAGVDLLRLALLLLLSAMSMLFILVVSACGDRAEAAVEIYYSPT
jgi:hypothetical protein